MEKGFLIVIGIALLIGVFAFFILKVEYPEVALIHIDGTIDEDTYEEVSDAISSANKSVDGYIFEINSPGGYVVPSERLANEIKSIKKPTVCVIDDVGASGAYWIASSCDYIIADNYSIVGSIGVTASYLEFSGLMKKYGIDYVRIVSGNEKDIGTPYRAPTPYEKSFMENITLRIRDAFVKSVAENRNLSYSYVSNLSDGRFFLGEDAVKLGLIDQTGDINTAKDWMKLQLNATHLRVKEYNENPLERLFLKQLSSEIVNRLFSENNKIEIRS